MSNDSVGDWLPTVLPERRGRALDLGCGAGRHAVLLAALSDRYLSREQFERVYSSVFDTASFTRVGNAHAILWDSPVSAPQQGGA